MEPELKYIYQMEFNLVQILSISLTDKTHLRDLFDWTVIRFWGEDIKKHTDECVKVVEETIFDNIEFEE